MRASLLAVAGGLALTGCAAPPGARVTQGVVGPSAATGDTVRIADVGFAAPENLVYDAVADVYLVANCNGDPSAADGDGFVSRVAPDGRMLALRWIAGGQAGVRLDAPKGLAIRGDTLAIADLDAVRFFDRRTGAPLGAVPLPGHSANDLAYAADGALWVTNTGPARAGGLPPDSARDYDAVYRLLPAAPGGAVQVVARGPDLDRPDGIVAEGSSALVAAFGADRLERVTPGVGKTIVDRLPGARLDGLRRLPEGALVVTSWGARTVWRLVPGTPPRALLTGVPSPAGVAVDARHGRLAVTSMQGNALYLLPLPR